MEVSVLLKRAGQVAGGTAISVVTVWSAANDGKTLHVPASGDFRESIIFTHAPADTVNGLTPERGNMGVVMGTSGPVAMVRNLLYPVST